MQLLYLLNKEKVGFIITVKRYNLIVEQNIVYTDQNNYSFHKHIIKELLIASSKHSLC